MKASSIVMAVVAGALLVSPGLAHGRTSGLAAEAATTRSEPEPKSPVAAQEEGRRNDPRLVGTTRSAPVVVAGPADGFDVTDAAIGAALGVAAALVAMAALSLWNSRERRAGTIGA